MFKIFLTVAMSLMGFSCSKAGESGPAEKAPESRVIGVGDQDLSPVASSIVISLSPGTRTDTLEGYIVGHRESLTLQYNEEKQIHLFKQVPPGTHDIILMSQDAAGNPIGKRVNGIQVSTAKGALVNSLTLEPMQTLTGTTHLIDGANCEGIWVYVPGTHIITQTLADGTFSLEGVPLGNHRLEFKIDGYQTGFIDVFKLTAKTTTELPAMILGKVADRGVSPLSSLDSLSVSFLINPPQNANEYRISTNQNFKNSTWLSLISIHQMTFDQAGTHTVYVQFANNGTQLSSIFSTEFEILTP